MTAFLPPLYQPLDGTKSEIRLLQIHPQESDDVLGPLRCSMTIVSLASLKERYLALSYVWGDDSPAESITVNNHTVPVTRNLLDILLRYRNMSKVGPEWVLANLPLWVDSVCINQDDIPERNSQVRLMASIYRSAEVLAWLGRNADDSEYAAKMIVDIALKMPTQFDKEDTLSWVDPDQPQLWQWTGGSGNQFWTSAGNLLQRAYWKRAWILQEIILAKNVMFICDTTPVPLVSFLKILNWLMHIREHECPPFADPTLWMMLTTRAGQRHLGWLQLTDYFGVQELLNDASRSDDGRLMSTWKRLLLKARTRQATDPRDKLYSMVGLLEKGVDPDYTLSTEEVYCSFARSVLEAEGRPDLLLYSGHGLFVDTTAEHPKHRLFLPSWVPNWDALSKEPSWGQFYHDNAHYHADKHPLVEQHGPLCTVSGYTLTVRGILRGEIATHHRFEKRHERLTSVWEEYTAAHKDERYVTGVPVLQALARLVLLDRDPETHVKFSTSPDAYLQMRMIAYALAVVYTDYVAAFKKYGFDTAGGIAEYLGQPVNPSRAKSLFDDFGYAVNKRGVFTTLLELRLSLVWYQQFFTTTYGYFGWGPLGMQKGDCVCIVFGCSMPLVLRRIDSRYVHIGACFVLGIMEGEIFNEAYSGSDTIREFQII